MADNKEVEEAKNAIVGMLDSLKLRVEIKVVKMINDEFGKVKDKILRCNIDKE